MTTVSDAVRSRPARLSVYAATNIEEPRCPRLLETVEGASLSLECRAITDDNLEDSLAIRWIFNNETFEMEDLIDYHGNSHVDISISNAKKSHSGIYQCVARTSLDDARSEPCEVIVRERTRLEVSPAQLDVVEGGDLQLDCTVTAATPAEVTWYRDGLLLSRGPRLDMRDVTAAESGGYTCGAETRLDTVNSTLASVRVLETMKVISRSKEIEKRLLGTDLTLQCEAQIDPRIPTQQIHWTWLKDQQIVSEENSVTVTNLLLRNVSDGDGGRYVCAADTNIEKTQQFVSQLKISTALHFINAPENRTIAEGEPLNLDCEVVVDADLLESTRMSWYKNAALVSSIRDTSYGLSIQKASLDDTGTYSCLVENELERELRNISVLVLGKTVVSVSYNSVELMEGEDLELSCTFATQSELVEISWFRGSSLLLQGLEERLVVEAVSPGEEGEYRCVLQTALDRAEASVSVRVYRRTNITTEYRDIEVTAGSNISIFCSANVDPRLSQNSTTIFIKEKFLIEPQSEKVDLFQHFKI